MENAQVKSNVVRNVPLIFKLSSTNICPTIIYPANIELKYCNEKCYNNWNYMGIESVLSGYSNIPCNDIENTLEAKCPDSLSERF